MKLNVGDRVIIKGYTSRPDLEGQSGVIRTANHRRSSFQVTWNDPSRFFDGNDGTWTDRYLKLHLYSEDQILNNYGID